MRFARRCAKGCGLPRSWMKRGSRAILRRLTAACGAPGAAAPRAGWAADVCDNLFFQRRARMFGNWFDCKEVDEFADTIVADLVKRFPPSDVGVPARKAADRLNLYKKAHLGNRVKWALKEAGYPEEFVDALTYELVTVVTLVSGRRGKVGR